MKRGLLLASIIAIAGFFRFDGLGVPSYWLDEILHQNITTSAESQPWWRWLTGFERENGPLYYATQVAGRLFGTSEFAGRLLPALFGVAAIVLVALISRTAALLLAVSPLAVYFSREARPYSLFTLLAAALIVLLLRKRTASACAVIVATLYTGAMGAPVVAGALVVALLLRARWVAGVAAGTLALFPLLYRTNTHVTGNTPFPSPDFSFFMALLRNFSVTALEAKAGGRAAVAMFVLAVVGAVVLARRDRRGAIVVIGMTVVPLAVTLGTLWKFDHWYGARYIVPSVGGYAVLAGCGIEALTRRFKPAAIVIAAFFMWQAWPALRTEAWQKIDWRTIADKLAQYAQPGDIVIAGEQWSEAGLRYYLHGRVRLEGVPYPPVVQALINDHPHAWLVTDVKGSNETRAWMCRFPIVLASGMDGFRVHYAGDFLRERAGPAEFRAVAAAMGPHAIIDLAAAENRFLDSGWANPEGFRWAVGRRSSVTFPSWGQHDRVVRIHVMPFVNALFPQQIVTILLNEKVIARVAPEPGWSDQSFIAPAAGWKNGLNTLAFEFRFSAAPADLDRRLNDHRPLAVAFERIEIDDAAFSAAPARSAPYDIRIASAPFIDEKTIWRRTKTRFAANSVRHDAVDALLGRLGFDPLTTWPRLRSGKLHLDDLVESIAYSSDCEDDRAFLRRAFEILLLRAPGVSEERALLPLAAQSRVLTVGRMIKFDEFREQVLIVQASNSRRRFGSRVGS